MRYNFNNIAFNYNGIYVTITGDSNRIFLRTLHEQDYATIISFRRALRDTLGGAIFRKRAKDGSKSIPCSRQPDRGSEVDQASTNFNYCFRKGKNDGGYRTTRRDRLIYLTHLFVRVDVYVTFDALLTHISPAVARHPLALALGTFVLAKAAFFALIWC